MNEITITKRAARRFLVRAFDLDSFQKLPDVATTLERLVCVQMDSINVCGRMHDLILWPRVLNYAPAMLHDELYTHRRAFEYYFPNLCALPAAVYPLFVRAMWARQEPPDRWRGLLPEELAVADALLAEMDNGGALRSRTLSTAHGHVVSGWGSRMKLASHVLEKLWRQGVVSTERRVNFERWFDRTARLYPDLWMFHAGDSSLPSEEDEARERARLRLRMRRLFRLGKEARRYVELGGGLVRVKIIGARRDWYALQEDTDALLSAEVASPDDLPPTLHLLAPLDPLVYDRERLLELWDFVYTWEVYVPQARRRWGYYVLPVLFGDALVGRLDPKVDRATGVLNVRNLLWEDDALPFADESRGLLDARLEELARFQQAREVRHVSSDKTMDEGDDAEPLLLNETVPQRFDITRR